MRDGVLLLPIVISLIFLEACASSGPTATMTGETMTVYVQQEGPTEVELLVVEADGILCLTRSSDRSGALAGSPGLVRRFSADSISLVKVSGFRNNSWGWGVVAFQILPAILLGVAAASVDADAGTVVAVSLVPAGLSAVLFSATGLPDPEFPGPLDAEALEELRKYARFAGTLTDGQRAELFRAYGQGRAE